MALVCAKRGSAVVANELRPYVESSLYPESVRVRDTCVVTCSAHSVVSGKAVELYHEAALREPQRSRDEAHPRGCDEYVSTLKNEK